MAGPTCRNRATTGIYIHSYKLPSSQIWDRGGGAGGPGENTPTPQAPLHRRDAFIINQIFQNAYICFAENFIKAKFIDTLISIFSFCQTKKDWRYLPA